MLMKLNIEGLRFLVIMTALLPVLHAETIDIAAEDDWPPYSEKTQSSADPKGFAVDIVREAFLSQGVSVRFHPLPFARCLSYAESGRVMGCFNATQVDSNRTTYCWHPTPMFHEPLMIYGATDDPRSNLRVADLEGYVVGATVGYTYPDEFMKNEKIKRFDAVSDDHLVRMLVARRVEYILLNGNAAQLRILANPDLKKRLKAVGKISDDGFWLAFTQKHPRGKHYCETFEKGLQQIKRNGRYNELERAFRKRMGL